MTQIDLNAWSNVSVVVLLFSILCAVVVILAFNRLQRKYWLNSKAPFWFNALRLAVAVNTGFFSSKYAKLYLLPILN